MESILEKIDMVYLVCFKCVFHNFILIFILENIKLIVKESKINSVAKIKIKKMIMKLRLPQMTSLKTMFLFKN